MFLFGILILYMSDYYQDENKKDRSIFEIINGPGDSFLNAEEILAEGLDRPDWHLRYARNIVYLILVVIGAMILESFFFRYYPTLAQIDATVRITILALVVGITCVCGFFDNILDQESTEVRWFNYARFWFVLLSLGGLAFFIVIKVASVSTI